MRHIFGFIIILSTVHAYGCSNYYILVNETNTEVEVVPDPSIVDTAVFESLNSSIPKERYIGLNCLGVSTECSPIFRPKLVYGPDTRETEPVTKKTDVTWPLPKPSHYDDADKKLDLTTKCLKDIKHYLTSGKCNEKNDTSYGSTSFYRCNALPHADCGSTIPDGYVPSNLTRVHRENCESYIIHIKKLYHNSSDFLPYSLRPDPVNFEGLSCIDYSTTCILNFICTDEGKNCVNVYRYKPTKNDNYTECLSATELTTSTASTIETKTPTDSTNDTTTKPPTTKSPTCNATTIETESSTDSANATTTKPLPTTAPNNLTKDPTDSTNATTPKSPTTNNTTIETASSTDSANASTTKPLKTKDPTDSINTTTTKPPTSNVTTIETESSIDSANATMTKPTTTTAPTNVTKDPIESINTTTTKPPTSNVTTIDTGSSINSTNSTMTETVTTTAPTKVTKDPIDSSIVTMTKPPTTTAMIVKSEAPTDSANATTTTTPTTVLVTKAPTYKLNGTYRTNTKNVDLTNSELYANDGFRGFILELLGNTSETNFIVYVVLICVALFVGGMLFCLAVMTCARCNKRRKYAVEEKTAHDSPDGEETQLPMDIINQSGTADPTQDYFLLTSKEARGSMRSCSERRSYLKSEDFT